MADLSGFDATHIPEQQTFDALPAGDYVAIATASEMKSTKNGTGQYLQFVFEVIDGQYKGRKLWTRLNLVNNNATATDIAQRELAAICRAVGVLKPADSSELHNRPLRLTVDVEVDDRKRQINRIKKYAAPGATGTTGYIAPAQAPSAAAPAAPWQTGAQAQAAPAAAQPASAPAAATPPWAKTSVAPAVSAAGAASAPPWAGRRAEP